MAGQHDDLVTAAKLVSVADWANCNSLWGLRKSGANLIGPCPKAGCGGTDRFGINLFQDKWNCRICDKGGHDAISLVMHVDGLDFLSACEVLTGQRRSEPVDPEKAKQQKIELEKKQTKLKQTQEQYREKSRKQSHEIWQSGKPSGRIIEQYLAIRKINVSVAEFGARIRQHEKLEYWFKPKNKPYVLAHSGVAMLACIQSRDNRFSGVHRTWIDINQPKGKLILNAPDGSGLLDARLTRGSKGNGAIRLVTPENPKRLVLGEGIETTGTVFAHERDNLTAYWAGIDKGHMAGRAARSASGTRLLDQPDMADEMCFILPEWCTELIYLLDVESDEKQAIKTKQAMIRGLRRQKRLRSDLIIKLCSPGLIGDFNDLDMIK